MTQRLRVNPNYSTVPFGCREVAAQLNEKGWIAAVFLQERLDLTRPRGVVNQRTKQFISLSIAAQPVLGDAQRRQHRTGQLLLLGCGPLYLLTLWGDPLRLLTKPKGHTKAREWKTGAQQHPQDIQSA